jgi:hypothetical protein
MSLAIQNVSQGAVYSGSITRKQVWVDFAKSTSGIRIAKMKVEVEVKGTMPRDVDSVRCGGFDLRGFGLCQG